MGGADAVVIACSMYGDVREVAERVFTTPVFASDTDMIADIVRAAPRRVAVLGVVAGRGGRHHRPADRGAGRSATMTQR